MNIPFLGFSVDIVNALWIFFILLALFVALAIVNGRTKNPTIQTVTMGILSVAAFVAIVTSFR